MEPESPTKEPTIYTQTTIGTLHDCPKRYKLQHIDGWRRIEPVETLADGILWHNCLERASKCTPNEILAYIETQTLAGYKGDARCAKFCGMFIAYHNIMGLIDADDREVQFQFRLINPDTGRPAHHTYVAGKIDGVQKIDDEWWLIEHKTTSEIDVEHLTKLELNLQLHVYKRNGERLLDAPIAGVIYDIIKKPTIRLKLNQTPAEYRKEVVEWYHTNKATTFYREKFRLIDVDIERELWAYHRMIREFHRLDYWPRYPKSCHTIYGRTCGFLGYCTSGDNDVLLQNTHKKGELHPELKN